MKENTNKTLKIIEDAAILPKEDIKALTELRDEFEHGFVHGQIFRTRTEAEVSVLDDFKFPTDDAKYWQSIREQQVHFTELVMLSYEYQKNLKEIIILQAEIMELEEKKNDESKKYLLMKRNAEIGIKEIEIAKKVFIAANQKRTAQGRMAEIINWHEIKDQLKLQYSKTDVNEHQLGSYTRRYINEYLAFSRFGKSKSANVGEVRNLIGLLVSALNKCKEVGVVDDVIGPYSKLQKSKIMEVWKAYSVSETPK